MVGCKSVWECQVNERGEDVEAPELLSDNSSDNSVSSDSVVGSGVDNSDGFFNNSCFSGNGVSSFGCVFSLVATREKRCAECNSEN